MLAAIRPRRLRSCALIPSAARRLATAALPAATDKARFAPQPGAKTFTVSLPASSFEAHRCDAPALETTVSSTELLDMFREMMIVRRMEQASDLAYKQKLIRGFCHLCTGQEAVPIGIEAALTKADSLITAYRCHGFAYMRGQPVEGVLAELMGKATGTSHGKGGSMHIFGPEFYGGNGIVGAQVPVGAGIAFAHKYRGEPRVSVSLYGDGAANQGQVFEAYNMAKLWGLPAIFVCENNMYGMGTAAGRAAFSTKYYTRGDYIPGLRVNGMDVLAVRSATAWARHWAIDGHGPLVLELVTYRYGGHSMSDPGTTYRTREEINHMRSTSDCITGMRKRILQLEAASEDELKQMERDVRKLVDAAVEAARAAPEPPLSRIAHDVYAPGSAPATMRGLDAEEQWATS